MNDEEEDYSVGEKPPVRLLIVEPPKHEYEKKTYKNIKEITIKI